MEASSTAVVVVSFTHWPPAWGRSSEAWETAAGASWEGGVSWEEAGAGPLPAGLTFGRTLILDLRSILSYCREAMTRMMTLAIRNTSELRVASKRTFIIYLANDHQWLVYKLVSY